MFFLEAVKRACALACAVLLLGALSASAGDQKVEKTKPLSGVWVVDGGELKLEFSGKDALKIFPHGENKVIVIICQYKIAKDKRIEAKITDFDGGEEFKQKVMELLPIGLEFNFRWTVKGDMATLADVKGAKDKIDVLKSRLEAPYVEKK
jgi:hypothetical protein